VKKNAQDWAWRGGWQPERDPSVTSGGERPGREWRAPDAPARDSREDGAVSDDTYLMLVDGKVQAADLGPMMRRHRAAHVEARAGLIDQAAGVLANGAFSADEISEMWVASGLSDDDLDSAANVGVTLLEIEEERR
jgi:hypothetical protein